MESDIIVPTSQQQQQQQQQHQNHMAKKHLTKQQSINAEEIANDWQHFGDIEAPLKRFKLNDKSSCAIEPNVKKRLLQQQPSFALSPITELSKTLQIAKLGTPPTAYNTTKYANGKRPRQFRALQCEFDLNGANDNSTDAALFLTYTNKMLDTNENKESSIAGADADAAAAQPLHSFNSMSSTYSNDSNSLDEDSMSLYEMETSENVDLNGHLKTLPTDLDALISGTLKTTNNNNISKSSNCKENVQTPDMRRPTARRCLSMVEKDLEHTPVFRGILAKQNNVTEEAGGTGMVTTPLATAVTILEAERCDKKVANITNSSKILRKCMSMNDADIMSALARTDQDNNEPELIGDFSKPHALPLLVAGVRHRDLKTITCDTLAQLLNGSYDDIVENYQIIDCRYPYEYDGGHICGAQNLYTHEQILEAFPLKPQTSETPTKIESISAANAIKRKIIIFHCEFSSERGPKLMRFLRNNDRTSNTNTYPSLDYPEIYLLHNGYKEFFETHGELCIPYGYVPMLMPAYNEEYRHFRAKTKSWNGDTGLSGTIVRPKKSRSRLALNC